MKRSIQKQIQRPMKWYLDFKKSDTLEQNKKRNVR